MVQVVSMLDVIIRLGETVFQSNEVKGAVCSGVLELERRASGVSLVAGIVGAYPRVMVLLGDAMDGSEGNDHNRR